MKLQQQKSSRRSEHISVKWSVRQWKKGARTRFDLSEYLVNFWARPRRKSLAWEFSMASSFVIIPVREAFRWMAKKATRIQFTNGWRRVMGELSARRKKGHLEVFPESWAVSCVVEAHVELFPAAIMMITMFAPFFHQPGTQNEAKKRITWSSKNSWKWDKNWIIIN